MLIASTLARDAFATIVDPLGGIDSMSSIAGLFPLSGDGVSGQTGAGASPTEVPAAIHCLRRRPCPVSGRTARCATRKWQAGWRINMLASCELTSVCPRKPEDRLVQAECAKSARAK